jgi:hypothetical protein
MFQEEDFKSFSTFNTSKVALTIYNENAVRQLSQKDLNEFCQVANKKANIKKSEFLSVTEREVDQKQKGDFKDEDNKKIRGMISFTNNFVAEKFIEIANGMEWKECKATARAWTGE